MSDRFVYVTYIRTTPEKVWDALLDPEFNKLYWFGAFMQSEWKKGADWKIVFDDGRIADTGEIVEIEKPKKIVIKWRNEFMPEIKAEGWSQCTIELEPAEDMVKLTILHEIDKTGSKFIQAVSGGWPKIMSGLKTLLETGKPLAAMAKPKKA
jgi:uncharacterized protein YndB with AHSA1/START domain